MQRTYLTKEKIKKIKIIDREGGCLGFLNHFNSWIQNYKLIVNKTQVLLNKQVF